MGFMDFNNQAGQINNNPGQYRVMQVVLREKFVGKGSKNFKEIEDICNQQFAQGLSITYLCPVHCCFCWLRWRRPYGL